MSACAGGFVVSAERVARNCPSARGRSPASGFSGEQGRRKEGKPIAECGETDSPTSSARTQAIQSLISADKIPSIFFRPGTLRVQRSGKSKREKRREYIVQCDMVQHTAVQGTTQNKYKRKRIASEIMVSWSDAMHDTAMRCNGWWRSNNQVTAETQRLRPLLVQHNRPSVDSLGSLRRSLQFSSSPSPPPLPLLPLLPPSPRTLTSTSSESPPPISVARRRDDAQTA